MRFSKLLFKGNLTRASTAICEGDSQLQGTITQPITPIFGGGNKTPEDIAQRLVGNGEMFEAEGLRVLGNLGKALGWCQPGTHSCIPAPEGLQHTPRRQCQLVPVIKSIVPQAFSLSWSLPTKPS